MRSRIVSVLCVSLLLTFGTAVAQEKKHPQSTADRTAPATSNKPEVTYGHIKELTTGQKVVVEVDNAMDKTYDLTDQDTSVKLAANLKVGDPVKITERESNGKKTVQIVRHKAPKAKGERSRSAQPSDTTQPQPYSPRK